MKKTIKNAIALLTFIPSVYANNVPNLSGGIPDFTIEKVKYETLKPGVERFFVSGDMGSFGVFKFAKGTSVSPHLHLPEAIMYVHSGKMEFTLGTGKDAKVHVLNAGEMVVVKSHIAHAAKALEDTFLTISSSPIRKDWESKTDTQLRK